MKRLIYVSFNPGRENWDKADKLLAEIGVTKFEHEISVTGIYSFTLEKGDIRIDKLINGLKKQNLGKPSLREERVYTKKEIDSAELLHLFITTYCGDGYNVYGTEFDKSNICTKCGSSGEVQKSDLIINKTEMGKKSIAITYNFEIVILDKLADILKENELTGYKLRPVRHYTDKMRNEPKLFQLVPTNTLPPTIPPTKIKKSDAYCSKCNKNGLYFDSELYYSRKDLKKICDFNNTYEYLGEKLTRGISHPRVIISQKAYQVLKQNKIKKMGVEPVNIVD